MHGGKCHWCIWQSQCPADTMDQLLTVSQIPSTYSSSWLMCSVPTQVITHFLCQKPKCVNGAQPTIQRVESMVWHGMEVTSTTPAAQIHKAHRSRDVVWRIQIGQKQAKLDGNGIDEDASTTNTLKIYFKHKGDHYRRKTISGIRPWFCLNQFQNLVSWSARWNDNST